MGTSILLVRLSVLGTREARLRDDGPDRFRDNDEMIKSNTDSWAGELAVEPRLESRLVYNVI
jgi:hypothetical protein